MSDAPANWFSQTRLSKIGVPHADEKATDSDHRTPHERDYDRLLFSAPVRRMADKTQVFPLDKNDSVRTRLTHSHEVANLARSIGNRIMRSSDGLGLPEYDRSAFPIILGAVGLAHDLGNPPFGHQGEVAIGSWFKGNEWVFSKVTKDGELLDAAIERERNEFLKFEGNAQTVRLLTRLQVQRDSYGVDLTAATMAALMKYTVTSDSVVGEGAEAVAANKKYGYFVSEGTIFSKICTETGLLPGRRHPLAWLMEACDDIAYSVLDIEDSVKKRIVSFHDILAYLRQIDGDDVIKEVVGKLEKDLVSVMDKDLSPNEKNDVLVQLFRVRTIDVLIRSVSETFVDLWDAINAGEQRTDLIKSGKAVKLVKSLKDFARSHAYNHRSVLEIELRGAVAIRDLMDWYWIGISDREEFASLSSDRNSAFSAFMYGEISENYRRIFEHSPPTDADGRELSIRYRELRLLTDMISGMTDRYAIETHERLKPVYEDYQRQN